MKIANLAAMILLATAATSCGGQTAVAPAGGTNQNVMAQQVESKLLTAKSPPVGQPVPCAESTGNRCVISVSVTPTADGSCSGSAISLADYVGLLDDRKHKKIEWQLPGGYQFCTRAGDGVFLDDPNVPDDLFELGNNAKCGQTLEWKRKKGDGNPYAYWLVFRNTGNTMRCVKDPFIKN